LAKKMDFTPPLAALALGLAPVEALVAAVALAEATPDAAVAAGLLEPDELPQPATATTAVATSARVTSFRVSMSLLLMSRDRSLRVNLPSTR